MYDGPLVRKGVQFEIEPLIWEKFKMIAHQERVTVPELVVQLVNGLCTNTFTELDREHGREYPNLIGR